MKRAVISDTSCLIALQKVEKLEILSSLFTNVTITEEVYQEFGNTLPSWITIVKNKNESKFIELQKVLDLGESSSIALALSTDNSLLIIDEIKGRKIAIKNGVEIIGTLGILILAKNKGLIDNLEKVIYDLRQNGFHISKKLMDILLG
ncbi:DUF3368 domain-containing protein [Algoriphagus taiwanensis]|uniref:DUF3368 domain-containing protein n=1 Tax=Algoriphagus taiwanensis TaxID=1445656 RepID=A0ABQ6PVP5_9BACT|nr:DUF3368 domain-containing protein [Algoriphagus taiwanensis]